jgi:hypothetical protein
MPKAPWRVTLHPYEVYWVELAQLRFIYFRRICTVPAFARGLASPERQDAQLRRTLKSLNNTGSATINCASLNFVDFRECRSVV